MNINATSNQINCQGVSNVKLIFRRWLNVEYGYYDHARIMGYDRGWTQLWTNDQYSSITESSWSRQVLDISSLAVGNRRFQLRFNLQSSASTQLSGWNIDDVVVKDGSLPDAEACGGCTNKPSFAGLKSARDADPCADTGVILTWPAAAAWGSGVSGSYAVHRDTTPNFTPSASNRIAAGVAATTYTDAAAPNGSTLYYLVRAENNESCSTGPANNGVTDDNVAFLSARDDTSQPTPGAITTSLREQLVNGAHVRLTWSAASGAAFYRVYRADNPQMQGALLDGSPAELRFDDVGEATTASNRFYMVKGVNTCNVEGP